MHGASFTDAISLLAMVLDSFIGVAAAASVEEKEERFHFTWRSRARVGGRIENGH
jgi:hypothetical protein